MAMNAASPHQEEARAFLEWLISQEGQETAAQFLPTGFFLMSDIPVTLTNPWANEFLALNNGRVLDARFVWPQLMDLYAPMNQAVISVLRGDSTPQEAADFVEAANQ